MSNHRRSCSLSEKLEAVQLMKQEGVGRASRQLEISSTTLYKWERHFDKHGEQGLLLKPVSDKNPELEKIKKENHELKMRNADQFEPHLAEQTGSSSILVKAVFLA